MGSIGRTQGVKASSRPNTKKARAIFHKLPSCSVAVARELSSIGDAATGGSAWKGDSGLNKKELCSWTAERAPGVAGSTVNFVVDGG